MRILITGANGFLGSHLVEEALRNSGYAVFSGIREGADISSLKELNTEIVTLNYQDQQSLTNTFRSISKDDKFDFIIHNAGLTKSNSASENLSVNKGLTENVLFAIEQSDILKKNGKFLYISSLAALGPVGTSGPISSYGRSKLEAEKAIQKSNVNYLIFRPTAIFGPRDTAFLAMFKAGKVGLYPNITSSKQKITMIYGPDVAKLVFYYSNRETNKTLHLDDGHIYSHRELNSILSTIFKRKVLHFTIPAFLMYGVLFVMETWAKISNYKPILTREKYNEIKRDWDHSFPFEHENLKEVTLTSLTEGFSKTLVFYQKHRLL